MKLTNWFSGNQTMTTRWKTHVCAVFTLMLMKDTSQMVTKQSFTQNIIMMFRFSVWYTHVCFCRLSYSWKRSYLTTSTRTFSGKTTEHGWDDPPLFIFWICVMNDEGVFQMSHKTSQCSSDALSNLRPVVLLFQFRTNSVKLSYFDRFFVFKYKSIHFTSEKIPELWLWTR